MCICTAGVHMCVNWDGTEDVSEPKIRFWEFAWAMSESSSSHVLDPCSCADGSHVLMQPSGLSDTEWHHVPFPDLWVKTKMERWVERKRYVEGKQKVREGTKNKTNVNHCRVAGRRGWWQEDKRLMESRGSSEGWRDLCWAVGWIGWTWAAC